MATTHSLSFVQKVNALLHSNIASTSRASVKLADYNRAGAKVVPGEFLIGGSSESTAEILEEHNLELLETFEFSQGKEDEQQILHVRTKDLGTAEHTLSELLQDDSLRFAEPNVLLPDTDEATFSRPNDLDPRQWGLENKGHNHSDLVPGVPGADIKAVDAWKASANAPKGSTLVAVIDTGIDLNHPDLKDQLWTNPNEIPNGIDDDGNGIIDDIHGIFAQDKTGNPQDPVGHGTHVAGIIAAESNNGQGITGVDPNVTILPVRGIGPGTSMASALFAIQYAEEQGAEIFNHSWGVPGVPGQADGGYPAIAEAIRSSSALHVCAVGNDGVNLEESPRYPACLDSENIVGVGATDASDKLSLFSNYGSSHVDVTAPGTQIWSTVPGDYGFKNGTSMAAPAVTGVASLIKRNHPELTAVEIKERLMSSADKKASLKQGSLTMTGGRLNASRALSNDSRAPIAAGDLNLSNSAGVVEARWTAASDEGDAVANNVMKWSFSPIRNEGDFQSAKALRTQVPSSPGQSESARLALEPSSQTRQLHIALQSHDEVGNTSAQQNASAIIPGREILFDQLLGGWQKEGSWGLKQSSNGEVVWSDSPNGYYDKGLNASLTSSPINLSRAKSPRLYVELQHEYDPQDMSDRLELEIKPVGQNQWRKLETFHGIEDKHGNDFDLSAYSGQNVQVRFRVVSDIWEERRGSEIHKFVISDER